MTTSQKAPEVATPGLFVYQLVTISFLANAIIAHAASHFKYNVSMQEMSHLLSLLSGFFGLFHFHAFYLAPVAIVFPAIDLLVSTDTDVILLTGFQLFDGGF